MPRTLRPARFDDLGLRQAISDRLLPLLVAAMAFLGALALAGAVAASHLAAHWSAGAGSMLTVIVPQTSGESSGRLDRATSIVRATAGVESVRLVPDQELTALLRPWLGDGEIAVPLPSVIEVRLSNPEFATAPLAARLASAVPGTSVEAHETWLGRLSTLARSLQACAALAAVIVALVAAAVVAVATRAGLTARRQSIEIVHGLGATDGYIAGRFAGRATMLATAGAVAGAVAALPVLLGLASLAAPFGVSGVDTSLIAALPRELWMAFPLLPLSAAAIGWATAQGTVRRWLRRLP